MPLLRTKLYRPAVASQSIDRPRLMAQLDQALHVGCRMIVVSAPAGFGKTTLVTQWLDRAGIPAAWLSLDERDNRPARFFDYLIAALQELFPEAGRAARELLALPAFDLDEVVTLLANDLASAPGPFALALDDAHVLHAPELYRAIDALVDAQPAAMRLLLLSREDPPLRLALRRARGQLVEIRSGDLRFTLDEASAFLEQRMGLHLQPNQVDALEARTEGWAAGLQMAALSLLQAGDPERFIREFSGSHRFILDFLVEEVLSRQSPEVQQFLLRSAVFERFCASLLESALADPAMDNAALQQQLEALARANLFLIPLDEERHWFRYHHLFADLLRARLAVEAPGLAAALHRRASVWYDEHDDPRLAVEQALAGDDPERAADLIERYTARKWQTTDTEFMLLAGQLPPALVQTRPALCLLNAWMAIVTGQVQRVEPLLDATERALNQRGRPLDETERGSLAFVQVLRAYLDDFRNKPPRLGPELDLAFASIPEEAVAMHNSVAVMLGQLYATENQFEKAEVYYLDAIQRDMRAQGTNAVPIATSRLARMRRTQGRLRESERLLLENEAYVRLRGSRRYYIAGSLNALLGEHHLERGEWEAAEGQIALGRRLLEDWPSPNAALLGLSAQIRLDLARGRLAEARAVLEQAGQLLAKFQVHAETSGPFDLIRVRLWAAEGNLPALEAWVQSQEHETPRPLAFRFETYHLALAQAWLALDRPDEAAALLEDMAALAESQGRLGSLLEIRVLLAAALVSQPEKALPILELALRQAQPEGYWRVFFSGGEALRGLLAAWLRRVGSAVTESTPLREYARGLLKAFEAGPAQPAPAPAARQLEEPLSERELEVLRLVGLGLSNQQIADRLVISIRTVKKHMVNIHGKLGVNNRTQAVAKGREIGLL